MTVAVALLVTGCGGGRGLPDVDVVTAADGVAAPAEGDVLVAGGWPTVAAYVADAAADGRATVVNLFGSWCEPCIDELPLLLSRSRDTVDVRWLGVAVRDTERNADRFVEELGVTWPTVLDVEATTHEALDGRVMPTTAFFDDDGRLVGVVDGIIDAEQLDARLAELGG